MRRIAEQIHTTTVFRRVRTVDDTYTVDPANDEFLRGDATGGAFAITLPPAATCFDTDTQTGKVFEFKKIDAVAAVTIEGAAAETIDGAANVALAAQYETLRVVSNGTSWDICSTDRTGTIDSADIVNGAIDLAHMSANSVDSDQYVDGSIDLIHMSANSVDSDQYVDGSIDTAHFAAGAVDAAALGTGAVTPVKILATAVAPAADAAAAITSATTRLILQTANGSNTAISTSSSVDGQRITCQMPSASGGGSYTLAVTGGNLTFNAANETALIERIGAAWVVIALNGATIV